MARSLSEVWLEPSRILGWRDGNYVSIIVR
jgi:hypothetical protein